MKAARKAIFPNIPWQRCQFHFAQNAQSYIPKRHLKEELGQALKDIWNCLTKDEARQRLQVTLSKYQKIAPEWCQFLAGVLRGVCAAPRLSSKAADRQRTGAYKPRDKASDSCRYHLPELRVLPPACICAPYRNPRGLASTQNAVRPHGTKTEINDGL
jgi:hypothetical protein